MSDDLKKCNIEFRRLLSNLKEKPDKKTEALLYLFFLSGFKFGSGIEQEAI